MMANRPLYVSLALAALLAVEGQPAAAATRQPRFDEIAGSLRLGGQGAELVDSRGSFRLVAPGYDGDTIGASDLSAFTTQRLILRGLRYRADGNDYFVVQMFGPEELGPGLVSGRVNKSGKGVEVPPPPVGNAKKSILSLPKKVVAFVQGGMPKGGPLYRRVGVMASAKGDKAVVLINPQQFPSDKISIRPRAPRGYRLMGMQSPGWTDKTGTKGNTPGYNNSNDVRGVAFVKDGVDYTETNTRSFAIGKFLPALKDKKGKVRAFQVDAITPPRAQGSYVNFWQLPTGARREPIRPAATASARTARRTATRR